MLACCNTAGSLRLLVRAHMSNSVSDEAGFFYLAEDLTPGVAAPEGCEQLELRWEPLATVMKLISAGEITDAPTILAVQQLVIERLQAGTFDSK